MSNAPFDELSLVRATRPGGRNRTERAFLDFKVGRRGLSSLFRGFDRIGVLGSLDRGREKSFARQLLLLEPPSFASGRVPLYVCPECADLGCGAIAARATLEEGAIVWSDFREESASGSGSVDTFWPLPDFRFEWEAYRGVLASYAATRRG